MTRAFSARVSVLHDPWGAAPGYDEHCAFGAKRIQSGVLMTLTTADAKQIPRERLDQQL